MNDKKDLTAKQKRFCDEYLIDLNATQAAIRAGYSEKNADKIASQLLGKTRVAEEIQKRKAERSERTEITQDMVLRELAAIAFANATDIVQVAEKAFVTDGGNEVMLPDVIITETSKLTSEQKKAIAGIKQGRNGIEVKMNDKTRALELLGKHLGMFTEKVELTEKKKDPFDDLTAEEIRQMIDDD